MDDEQIKRMIQDSYDESKEKSYVAWVKDFYMRELPWVTVLSLVLFLSFWVLAILCGILFFRIDQTRSQIKYAAMFVCCTQGIMFAKTVGWQTMQRNRIVREIKRLELRIAELVEAVKTK